jgi:hypothetical protein
LLFLWFSLWCFLSISFSCPLCPFSLSLLLVNLFSSTIFSLFLWCFSLLCFSPLY